MLEKRIQNLDDQLKEMAGHVRQMIEKAVKAVKDKDLKRISEVNEADEVLANQMETWNLEEAVRVIALFQPMGENIRRLITIVLTNRDLERIGDHATNIAGHARFLAENDHDRIPAGINAMAEVALLMVDHSIQAYKSGDEELAKRVIYRDNELNRLTKQTIGHLLKVLATNCDDPECDEVLETEILWRQAMICRNLERVGDHATNIAESVLFVVESHLHLHHKREIAEEIRRLDGKTEAGGSDEPVGQD